MNAVTEAILIALTIINNLIWPVGLVIFLIIAIRVSKTGKIGKLDLNSIIERRLTINAGDGASVSVGPDIPLDIHGRVDQQEFAKRTWVLIQQYHVQGLQQSRISFYFSIVAAIVGFFVITVGAMYNFNPLSFPTSGGSVDDLTSGRTLQAQPILIMVSGVVIDAVAALFFVQSNKARALMADFFDRLRVDRKLEEALSLIKDIPDKKIAGRTQALLAINLAEIELDGPIFDRILTGEYLGDFLEDDQAKQSASSSVTRKSKRSAKAEGEELKPKQEMG